MKKVIYNIEYIIITFCVMVSCCSKENYLLIAERMSNYDCVDSLVTAWKYIQEANKETNKVVGLNIAKNIVHKTDSLFDIFLQTPDLDSAAKCFDVMGQIISYYGELPFIQGSDNIGGEEQGTTIEKLDNMEKRRERLADSYYRQARSAERLWKRFADNKEHQLMLYSDSLAHKFNPEKY